MQPIGIPLIMVLNHVAPLRTSLEPYTCNGVSSTKQIVIEDQESALWMKNESKR